MTRRYRVALPQAEPYRVDHAAVAGETLGDLARALVVILAVIAACLLWMVA